MELKNIANKVLDFILKRFIEFLAVFISIASLLLLVSLLSYSPEDPNFIFPDNTKINNLLGFKGSFISDLFFQSLGLISVLISVSLCITGINIFRSKKLALLVENLFFIILYTIFGSFFFSIYHTESFALFINGNGGFVGKFLENTILISLVSVNKQISYYVLIFIILFLFFVSINFKTLSFLNFLKNIFSYFIKNKNKSKKDFEIITKNENDLEQKRPIQENFPFIKQKNESKNNF